MNKYYLKKIRDHLPEPLKYITAPLFRRKLTNNKAFRECYSLLERRNILNTDELSEYQLKKLKEILIHSFENVPYYAKLFEKVGFDPYGFSGFSQMERIPYLTRELINENYDKLISRGKIKDGFYQGSTGGSSGIPLKFLLDYDSIYLENAFIYNFRKKLGYQLSDRCATFRQADYGNELWRLNPMHNEIIFSPFRLSDKTVKLYARKINSYKPHYLNGYLSAIWFFARLLEQNNIKLNFNIKGIFLISENVDLKQRRFVEEFFNAKTASFYGHSERCVFAEEIEPGKYKFDPFYGYTEFLPYDNEKQLIVGTGFLNYTMPFIRYKTDDVCIKTGDLYYIEGKRASNKGLIGANNEFLSSSVFDLENPVFKNVLNYQFVQKEKGKANLRIVVSNQFHKSELKLIEDEINRHTKGVIEIQINIVDRLILSPRGKYQMYIIELPDQKTIPPMNN